MPGTRPGMSEYTYNFPGLLLPDRPRIARRPSARLNTRNEIRHHLVEQRRLLDVDDVAALREHHQPRRHDPLLEIHARLDTRIVLVADHHQRRHRDSPDLLLEVVDRR